MMTPDYENKTRGLKSETGEIIAGFMKGEPTGG
jgi:hypothetical protein